MMAHGFSVQLWNCFVVPRKKCRSVVANSRRYFCKRRLKSAAGLRLIPVADSLSGFRPGVTAGLKAWVGIGRFTPLLRFKYTRIHWLFNIIRLNPA
jgi:hypothetical protein